MFWTFGIFWILDLCSSSISVWIVRKFLNLDFSESSMSFLGIFGKFGDLHSF